MRCTAVIELNDKAFVVHTSKSVKLGDKGSLKGCVEANNLGH